MARAAVTLFVPCLVDQLYPEMGRAAVRILEHLGCPTRYDPEAACCGQPAFNAGHRAEAKLVARKFLARAGSAEVLVCPSGSCTAMVRNFYPGLFLGDTVEREASELGSRTFEFAEYLAREGLVERIQGSYSGRIAFHNSCHAARELELPSPLALLGRISGVEVVGSGIEPACCGFGGLFSLKFAPIALTMAKTRLESFTELGVELLVSNDPGCILHLRQACEQQQLALQVLHLTEFLARAMGV